MSWVQADQLEALGSRRPAQFKQLVLTESWQACEAAQYNRIQQKSHVVRILDSPEACLACFVYAL